MQRIVATLLFVLIAGGCSSTSDSGSDPVSTVEDLASSSDEDQTEDSPTSAETPSASDDEADFAALTPVYTCTEESNGAYFDYFGYENASATAVAVLGGPGNQLFGSNLNDEALTPTVFAPGIVFPAFWALREDAMAPVVWLLTGPDGMERSASADEDSFGSGTVPGATCEGQEFEPTTPDPRRVEVLFSYRVEPGYRDGSGGEPTGPAGDVELVAGLVGLPDLSLCPAGLEPEPVEIQIGRDVVTTEGRQELPDERGRPSELNPIRTALNFVDVNVIDPDNGLTADDIDLTIRRTGMRVAFLVIDVCSFEGQLTSSYALASSRWNEPQTVCLEQLAPSQSRPVVIDRPIQVMLETAENQFCPLPRQQDGIWVIHSEGGGGPGMRIR